MTKRSKCSGFSLVEVILASALLSLLVTIIYGGFQYGRESTALAGARARAVLIAEEGLEATRNIRDETFSALTDGQHGLSSAGGVWSFSGTSDVTDIFTRQINIGSIDPDRKIVTSTVTWQQNALRNGTIAFVTELTNWAEISGLPTCSNQASHLSVDSSGASLTGGNRRLTNVLVENTNATCNIVIDRVTVVWTNILRRMTQVRIDNSSVWTGSVITGTEVDVTNTTIENVDGQLNTQYWYNGNMSGNIFTITYTMSDGTIKIEAGIIP